MTKEWLAIYFRKPMKNFKIPFIQSSYHVFNMNLYVTNSSKLVLHQYILSTVTSHTFFIKI